MKLAKTRGLSPRTGGKSVTQLIRNGPHMKKNLENLLTYFRQIAMGITRAVRDQVTMLAVNTV